MKNYSRRMIMTCFLVFCSLFFLSVPQRVRGDDNVQEFRLVAGNKWAKDEDAFVFVILGDGFTEAEQEFFFEKAEKTAGYILETSPFKEHQEIFKLYALGCISGESGARGDKAQSKQEEIEDSRDTLFHSRFWTEGVQRLLSIDESEEKKALLMAKQYVPQVDYAVVLVNSETYGGSGGQVFSAAGFGHRAASAARSDCVLSGSGAPLRCSRWYSPRSAWPQAAPHTAAAPASRRLWVRQWIS